MDEYCNLENLIIKLVCTDGKLYFVKNMLINQCGTLKNLCECTGNNFSEIDIPFSSDAVYLFLEWISKAYINNKISSMIQLLKVADYMEWGIHGFKTNLINLLIEQTTADYCQFKRYFDVQNLKMHNYRDMILCLKDFHTLVDNYKWKETHFPKNIKLISIADFINTNNYDDVIILIYYLHVDEFSKHFDLLFNKYASPNTTVPDYIEKYYAKNILKRKFPVNSIWYFRDNNFVDSIYNVTQYVTQYGIIPNMIPETYTILTDKYMNKTAVIITIQADKPIPVDS